MSTRDGVLQVSSFSKIRIGTGKTFDFDRDVERTVKSKVGTVDALPARTCQLSPNSVGKLIMYHGWS